MSTPVRRLTLKNKKGEPTTSDSKSGNNNNEENDNENPKMRLLPGPTQSPRDPNMYRVIRLQSGMLVALASTCEFTDAELEENKKLSGCSSMGRVKTGTRSKCRRARSDFDTPNSKRSRPGPENRLQVILDQNCVDVKVDTFNKEILHICESENECKKPTAGLLSMIFPCCSPPTNENLEIEGDAENMSSDVSAPGDALRNDSIETRRESQWPTKLKNVDGDKVEILRNIWNKADRMALDETEDEEPKLYDCSKRVGGKFSICSVAVTLPWGPIFEADDAPGVSEIARNCIHGCSFAYPFREEEHTTFVSYASHKTDSKNLVEAVECLAKKFYQTTFDKSCVDELLKRIDQVSYTDRLRTTCWGKGSDNILLFPKRVKLLSKLSKPDHPIRKCAMGGKADKQLKEVPRASLDRGLNDYLRNNCKPQYMTIAIEGPESLDSLEKIAIEHFGGVGSLGTGKNPGTHKIEGADSDPFDTDEFRKLYKVLPCPGQCDEKFDEGCGANSLILSFPLPGDAWRNYKTRPLQYLEHIVSHRGTGGLYNYLYRKNWINTLRGECSQTQFHRNQFCSLFEIYVSLTDEGFENRLEVIKAVFSYLKFLNAVGPKKRIYKELQRLQAIEFHSLGKGLEELVVVRDARYLSKGLQFAVAEDTIISQHLMTSYNGQLLRDYLALLTPELANFMLVSNSFDEEEITEKEEYLNTRYGVEDIPSDWMSALKGISSYPEYILPSRNKFIPEYFCTPESENSDSDILTPKWLSGDDFHDLWHLRDLRYKTKAAAVLHFVSPLAMFDLASAVKMTLFYRVLKALVTPALYPSEIAGSNYTFRRTDFGVMIQVEANADNLAPIIGTMAERLHTMQDSMDEEFFNNERIKLRKKICFRLRDSSYYSKWLHTTSALLNAWLPNEYLPVLDQLSMDDMKKFIEVVKKDLYIFLLVVGNVRESDAKDLCESILKPMNRESTGKNIEQIEVLQWPVGENIIRVKSLGTPALTSMNNHYQFGIANSKTVVMAALIEPLLQDFFLRNQKLMDEEIIVMIGGYQLHNVLFLQIQVEVPDEMTAEKVNDMIEEELVYFYENKLCPLKMKELDEMKKFYLCSCKPTCAWFSSNNNLNLLSQGVLNLNMNAIGVDVLTRPCECMKVKDLQEWYKAYFLEPDWNIEVTAANAPERRKLTIIIMKNPPKIPPCCEPVVDPKVKKEKKKLKKKIIPYSKEDCQKMDLNFDLPSDHEEKECKKNKGKKNKKTADADDITYIEDLDDFKENCFVYPSYIPRD